MVRDDYPSNLNVQVTPTLCPRRMLFKNVECDDIPGSSNTVDTVDTTTPNDISTLDLSNNIEITPTLLNWLYNLTLYHYLLLYLILIHLYIFYS